MTTLLPAALLLALSLPASANPANATPGTSGKAAKEEVVRLPLARPAQDTAKVGAKRRATGSQLTIAAAQLRDLIASAEMAAPEPPTTTTDPAEATEPNAEAAALTSTFRRPEAPMGRRVYRTRLLRTGYFTTRREAVEILTCTYAGPLVLAQLPATAAAPAQLLAGPGYDPAVALRPLPLTQEAVLRLCGDRAPQVLAYARYYDLHFQQAEEVARMFDYYNRIATIKWRMGE
ncbi:MAG TPA: hypothetical protein VFO93_12725 [Hymenobacter sp.]|uniref:hypothetical protein n=1 Tax=Hymenobacter sp. TaxID=1898978 RepID=UPI002D7E50E0|nr:hypothetical protein [Hymenobacter sp.]HET9504398.1 hypothetical protein [Hymenobacter sp.]